MKDFLIAHRGEPATWPENSIEGYQQVMQQGAQYIETDVQISADGVAILNHDLFLKTVNNSELNITKTNLKEIKEQSVAFTTRSSSTVKHYQLATLTQLVTLLQHYPDVTAFIEIKSESIDVFGIKKVVACVLSDLEPINKQCVIISFHFACLQTVKSISSLPIGWVLSDISKHSQQQAQKLRPNYIFVDSALLPKPFKPLWAGSWQWVLYVVNQYQDIVRYTNNGFKLIETNAITQFLHSKKQ